MTEFQRVLKERKRMCKAQSGCKTCPIYSANCYEWTIQNPESAEKRIIQWAAEHPIKTNRMKFEEIFGCGIVTHEIHEAIPGHVEILNVYDEEFETWLNSEYKGEQDETD